LIDMPLKSLIIISGTVIASAVTGLPAFAPGGSLGAQSEAQAPYVAGSAVARKSDRLRLLDPACIGQTSSTVCADIYGVAQGPRPTRTIGRRIGGSTTVLIRLPLSQTVPRSANSIAEN
jgi:hypothetical protein